jgi:hypothetical protein
MALSEPMRNRSLSAIGAVGANVQSVDRASNETFTDLRQVLLRWQDGAELHVAGSIGHLRAAQVPLPGRGLRRDPTGTRRTLIA